MSVLEQLADIGNILILVIVGIVLYFLLKTSDITYYIEPSPLNADFDRDVRGILNTSSVHKKYNIKEVYDVDLADIWIELRSAESLQDVSDKVEYYPGTNKQIMFSYTWQRPKPYIGINATNWNEGVPESGLSLLEYRRYVIQHEFMHALGFDHQPCNAQTAQNGVCPVLYQATRGPPPGFKSGYDISDIDYTKKLNNPYFEY